MIPELARKFLLVGINKKDSKTCSNSGTRLLVYSNFFNKILITLVIMKTLFINLICYK
jgi:hypothetical protein